MNMFYCVVVSPTRKLVFRGAVLMEHVDEHLLCLLIMSRISK